MGLSVAHLSISQEYPGISEHYMCGNIASIYTRGDYILTGPLGIDFIGTMKHNIGIPNVIKKLLIIIGCILLARSFHKNCHSDFSECSMWQ